MVEYFSYPGLLFRHNGGEWSLLGPKVSSVAEQYDVHTGPDTVGVNIQDTVAINIWGNVAISIHYTGPDTEAHSLIVVLISMQITIFFKYLVIFITNLKIVQQNV